MDYSSYSHNVEEEDGKEETKPEAQRETKEENSTTESQENEEAVIQRDNKRKEVYWSRQHF